VLLRANRLRALYLKLRDPPLIGDDAEALARVNAASVQAIHRA